MTVHCDNLEDVQEGISEALRSSIMPQPIDLPALEELGTLKGDRLGHFLLPSDGKNQQARRDLYTHEVLSGIEPNEKITCELDGFAVGVKTGLERGLGWKGAAFNLLAYSMTCGIFNLPRTAAVLGIVPFVFLVVVFQYMTWITGMAYSRLQARYPGVHSLPDAVHLIYGDAVRTIMSAANLVFAILLSGNHIILGSYAFRALGWKSCAVLLNFVFTAISFFFTIPRSYKLFANLAFVSALSVICCMIVASIAAYQHGPDHTASHITPMKLKAFGALSDKDSGFFPVAMAIANLFFAFGAHPCFFPLMGEMHRPEDFPKALAALITIQTTLYLVMTGVVLYSLGEYVTSPILASLSPDTERLCYILALPAIIISGCTSAQVSGKQLYISALRRVSMIKKKTSYTWITWIFINIITWTSAWILAELVPFFGSFMAVESSLIWVIFIAMGGIFALFLKMHRLWTGWRNRLETLRSLILIVFCVCLSVAGLWSAVRSITDSYRKGAIDYPFSCQLSSG